MSINKQNRPTNSYNFNKGRESVSGAMLSKGNGKLSSNDIYLKRMVKESTKRNIDPYIKTPLEPKLIKQSETGRNNLCEFDPQINLIQCKNDSNSALSYMHELPNYLVNSLSKSTLSLSDYKPITRSSTKHYIEKSSNLTDSSKNRLKAHKVEQELKEAIHLQQEQNNKDVNFYKSIAENAMDKLYELQEFILKEEQMLLGLPIPDIQTRYNDLEEFKSNTNYEFDIEKYKKLNVNNAKSYCRWATQLKQLEEEFQSLLELNGPLTSNLYTTFIEKEFSKLTKYNSYSSAKTPLDDVSGSTYNLPPALAPFIDAITKTILNALNSTNYQPKTRDIIHSYLNSVLKSLILIFAEHLSDVMCLRDVIEMNTMNKIHSINIQFKKIQENHENEIKAIKEQQKEERNLWKDSIGILTGKIKDKNQRYGKQTHSNYVKMNNSNEYNNSTSINDSLIEFYIHKINKLHQENQELKNKVLKEQTKSSELCIQMKRYLIEKQKKFNSSFIKNKNELTQCYTHKSHTESSIISNKQNAMLPIKNNQIKSQKISIKSSNTYEIKHTSKIKNSKCSNTNDSKCSNINNSKCSNTNDSKCSNTNDSKCSDTNDSNCSDTNDSNCSDTNDLNCSDPLDNISSQTLKIPKNNTINKYHKNTPNNQKNSIEEPSESNKNKLFEKAIDYAETHLSIPCNLHKTWSIGPTISDVEYDNILAEAIINEFNKSQ